jgi:hypothetical protein
MRTRYYYVVQVGKKVVEVCHSKQRADNLTFDFLTKGKAATVTRIPAGTKWSNK